MSERPTAAPAIWPYPHRTVAEVDACPQQCCDCGVPVSRFSSGRCQPCANRIHNRNPERAARQAATLRERKLAHIPPELRPEYLRLQRSYRYRAAEAARIILEGAA